MLKNFSKRSSEVLDNSKILHWHRFIKLCVERITGTKTGTV